jgi:hypothetical protein
MFDPWYMKSIGLAVGKRSTEAMKEIERTEEPCIGGVTVMLFLRKVVTHHVASHVTTACVSVEHHPEPPLDLSR